jgi:AraC-like DNA-binding protein
LYVSALIQEKPNLPVAKAAIRVGYPDGFTMSNQMKRLIGCRPSDVRDNLGLGWILEEWIHRERSAGRLEWHGYNGHTDDVDEWVDKHPARRTA